MFEHKRIAFKTREKVGVFLFELFMWNVPCSHFDVMTDFSVIAKTSNVIDVATESFEPNDYEITKWATRAAQKFE